MKESSLFEVVARSLVIHVSQQTGVSRLDAIDHIQSVCDELTKRGDKAITAKELVNLVVQRINQQKNI